MNTDNGKIGSIRDLLGDKMDEMSLQEQIEELKSKNYIQIDPKDMTQKQKREQKVSLNDHRSKLGKQLTSIQQRKKVFGK